MHGIVAVKLAVDLPQNVTFFSECNSDRIGQNIQSEVWLERSIFEVVVVYTLWAEALQSS